MNQPYRPRDNETRVSRPMLALLLSGLALSTVAAQAPADTLEALPGKVVIVTTPGGPSASELAVRLTRARMLDDGILRKIGEHAYVVDVERVSAEDLAAQPDVQGVFKAFERNGRFEAANNLLIKFRTPPGAAELQQFGADYDLVLVERIPRMDQHAVFGVRNESMDLAELLEAIAGDTRVERANLDRLSYDLVLAQLGPTQDPLLSQQWHLPDIGAQQAWDTTLGIGVRVGMLDDAVEFTHEDLNSNYVGFSQGAFGEPDASPLSPFQSHGTSVMGLICAAANTVGGRGVAPDAEFTATSGIGFAPASELMKAYSFAVDNEVEVHNNSWGNRVLGVLDEDLVEAIEMAADEGRSDLGMVILFASGNSGAELSTGDDYSTLRDVISIGGTGETDIKAGYSNYGVDLDFMAPTQGEGLRGMVTTTTRGNIDDIYTNQFNGTSASCPVASGVAALVLSVNSELDREQVRSLLQHSCEEVSPEDALYDRTRSFSLRYGYGRVDAEAAVEAATASLDDNETWPGIPEDFDVDIALGGEDGDQLIASIDWEPRGVVVDNVLRTDQSRVLIVQRTGTAEDDLRWRPTDGVAYEDGDIDNPVDGFQPPGNVGWFVIYSGDVLPPENGRQEAPDLAIDGDEVDDPQQFALFASNGRDEYAFGVIINQRGDVVDPDGDTPGGPLIPPDTGRPINPELDPGVIGEDQPPQVSASLDRALGGAPLTVRFFGDAVTPLNLENRGWSFGDGNSSAQEATTHTYTLPGVYNAVFFGENEMGVSTKLYRVEVFDPGTGGEPSLPLTATIRVTTPLPVFAPSLVAMTVDTTGVSSDVAAVSYNWEFGDGNFGTGKSTQNTYSDPGFYSALVRVTVERLDGSVEQTEAQTLISVLGTSPTGLAGNPGRVDVGGDAAGGSAGCGAMSSGLVALAFLSLAGWRRRTAARRW